ncbi:hypothetical protein [Clostridium sp.]
MSEHIIQQCVESSSFKKHFFTFKINSALKCCNKIRSYLLSNDYLTKSDMKLNLVTSDGISNEVDNSYLLYKRYNKDGSIDPIKKYTTINGEIVEYENVIKRDIIILDLYENSIYLHSYSKDSDYIMGYLIKEITNSKKNKTLIFSNEKVKVNIKNINKYETINLVDDFVDHFIM